MTRSLRSKMMLAFALTLLIMFTISSLITYNQAKFVTQDILLDAAIAGALQNAELINNWLIGLTDGLHLLAGTPAIYGMDWDEQLPVLKSAMSSHKELADAYIADAHGMARTFNGTRTDLSEADSFKAALSGKATYSDPIIGESLDTSFIGIAVPIYSKEHKVIGVIGYTVKLGYLQDIVGTMTIDDHGSGWIIDKNQVTLAHVDDKYIGNKDILTSAGDDLRDLSLRMVKGESGAGVYHIDGQKKILAFAPIKATGWSAALGANIQDVLTLPISKIKKFMYVITIISLFVGFVLAYIISHKVASPIVAFKNKTELIAQGDLTQTIDVGAMDEIGQLSESFNIMIEGLRHLIERVRDASEHTAAMSQEISASSQEVSASIEEVSASTEEFAASTSQLSQNAQEIASATGQMDKLAHMGMEQLKGNQLQMQGLLRSSENNQVIMGKLNKASANIQNIVGVISDIADQTNLLALNAAIEAARVGEHGRGFAVVADEVRKLAEGTQKSVGDIQNIVEQLISETRAAVSTIEDNNKQIKEGASALDKTAAAFLEITTLIRDIVDKVEAIAATTHQLSSGSQEIAAASNEQSASMEQVTSSIEELASLAQSLSDMVAQFKV